MSHDATVWAWSQDIGNSGDLIVLLALADMATEANDFQIWASHQYIGKKAKRSPRSVRTSIANLEAAGIVGTQSEFGRTDIITLLIPEEFTVRRQRDDGKPKTARTAAKETAAKSATAAKRDANRGNRCLQTLEGNQGDELKEDAGEAVKPVSEQARDLYNALAERCDWPAAKLLNDQRRKAISQRIKDAGGFDQWRDIMLTAETSDFLCGRSGGLTSWKPGLDFFLQASSFAKLAEGKYHERNGRHEQRQTTTDPRGDARAASHQRRTSNMLAGAQLAIDQIRRDRAG